MALVKCPDCGKEVSTEAKACPHCGRPSTSSTPTQPTPTQPVTVVRREAGAYEALGAVASILGVILAVAGSSTGNNVLGIIGGVVLVVGLIVFMIGRFK